MTINTFAARGGLEPPTTGPVTLSGTGASVLPTELPGFNTADLPLALQARTAHHARAVCFEWAGAGLLVTARTL